MNKPPYVQARALDVATGGNSPVETRQRIVLDTRRPQLLDHHGYALQVVAGHVDLFVLSITDAETEGIRQHLFRVAAGDIILDLPVAGDHPAERMRVIAVGGPGAEAVILPREQIEKFDVVADWIARLARQAAGPGVDWTIREAEPGERCELMPGERRRGAARGIVWASVSAGTLRLMGHDPAYRDNAPPVPLTSGMWIEAGETGSTLTCSAGIPSGADPWHAIDHFQVCAMACIRRRLASDAHAEAQRLVRRTQLTASQTHDAFDDLAAVIVPRPDSGRTETHAVDPLIAACRAVAQAIDAGVVRPPRRTLAQPEFEQVVEIARASRLRVRRTLLRGNWWEQDVGALVAWHGEERNPVALVPASRHRYLMIEPKSGMRRIVDPAIAMELSAEAAMLYAALPSRPLTFWDLLAFSARHARGNTLRIVLGALAVGALSLAIPVITQVLVDSVIPRTEFDQLVFCAAALAVTAIAMAALQAMQGIAMLRLEGVIDWRLQAALVDRLLRLPASLFRQYTVGDLADRALGIDAVRRIATGRILRGFMAAMLCWFSFLLMFYYDFRLALVALALTTLRAILIVASSAVRLYHEHRHFNLQGKIEGLVLQLLSGIGKLRVAAATIRALAVWAKQFAAQKRHFIASHRAANALEVAEAAFPTLATLIIFVVAQWSGSTLLLNLGVFLAFFAAFGQALASVGTLATSISESLIAIPHLSRMRPLIAAAAEISEDRKPAGELSGSIELSRVTFRYVSGGPPVLDNVTLRIAPGEYVAVVGPSGSGKSTILRLLLGFEKPEAGAVFFDGKALDTLDVSTVRRQMGVVLQHSRLATGSIYDNICGGMQLPMDQAWEAARLAGLDADIQAMPMGMHTGIAEGVSTMSGGQRQRLMIARAVARRPRILLLDEATSSLDNQAQAIVSASLGRLNVTRVVIAHRLSTVREADRIVVLVDGKIVQTGSFTELSAAAGIFADFARRQLL
jgi:NHLM bacteriocin system ABC transporter ATP-binding protein